MSFCTIWESPVFHTQPQSNIIDHPLIDHVRAGVDVYRMKSLNHFCLHIRIQQADRKQSVLLLTKNLKLAVNFQTYERDVHRMCRPVFYNGKSTKLVEIKEKGKWIRLQQFLHEQFPSSEAVVTDVKMRNWWDVNGKIFNWSGLATEIKMTILEYCLEYRHSSPRYLGDACENWIVSHYPAGLYEVMERLGAWGALLETSFEVRAITLSLCLKHNKKSPGLCLSSHSAQELRNALTRLSKFSQVVEQNSVPTTHREKKFAMRYLRHPKIYPELSRYATMMHGIRKISLSFGMWDMMHFWRVNVGGLDRVRPYGVVTCDIFDRLPHLNEIRIVLPKSYRDDVLGQRGIEFIHHTRPCYRTLHRLIYERIATFLAAYKNVTVLNFLDDEEEIRYNEMRKKNMATLNLTDDDITELYEDTKGGIELAYPIPVIARGGRVPLDPFSLRAVPNVFPPNCKCKTQCRNVVGVSRRPLGSQPYGSG